MSPSSLDPKFMTRYPFRLAPVLPKMPALRPTQSSLPLLEPNALPPQDPIPLVQVIAQTYIIAYREETDRLEQVLQQAGLSCEVLRQADCPEYQRYSSSYRCFLNHQQAWQRAARSCQLTLIVEADFVPVVGFGQLPLPFDRTEPQAGICWLYTCAPQLYSVSTQGFAHGFSTGLVAYILTPQAAQALCEFAHVLSQPNSYTTFDSQIECFLRSRQFRNYIPFRNYGEHGGKPNPEHYRYGLSRDHRADVLWGQLAFPPTYAEATAYPQLTYTWIRSKARLKGILRLLIGKFLRLKVLQGSTVSNRLIGFALRRQFTFRL
ncbi:MAG: LPS biosynthesis glycosyltransferase [Elainella sp. Prado103]|nr:LPS biosynthesis glycosyltransferase [Elainella sp. Prado103]